MNIEAVLHELGVRPTEVSIYLTLLRQGPASIRNLAESTKINRGTTHDALKHLTTIGLVTFTLRGERRNYRAENPDKIIQLIEERKQTTSQMEKSARDLLPSLHALTGGRQGEPAVKFFENDEGIALVLRDVLATAAHLPRKQYYAYSSRSLRKYLYRRFPNFTKQRIAAQISVKVIAVGEGGEIDEYSERRWIEQPPSSTLSSYTIVYGNKIALISVSADETPYAVVIEEAGVATMQQLLFDQLWQSLKADTSS